MSTLSTIETGFAKWAPSALAAVIAVENTAKYLAGAQKKALVVNMVSSIAKVAEQAPSASVAGIGAMVDVIVTILNATGLFTHSSAAASTTADNVNQVPAA